MSDDGIVHLAVREMLEAIPGVPDILWPNTARKLTPPFLIFEEGAGGAGTRFSLSGKTQGNFTPQISIITALDNGTTDEDTIRGLILDAFKPGTIITHSTAGPCGQCNEPTVLGSRRDLGTHRRDIILSITSVFGRT